MQLTQSARILNHQSGPCPHEARPHYTRWHFLLSSIKIVFSAQEYGSCKLTLSTTEDVTPEGALHNTSGQGHLTHNTIKSKTPELFYATAQNQFLPHIICMTLTLFVTYLLYFW